MLAGDSTESTKINYGLNLEFLLFCFLCVKYSHMASICLFRTLIHTPVASDLPRFHARLSSDIYDLHLECEKTLL